MANVGYATLQIIPSAKGFSTALEGQVGSGLTGAGVSGGKKFGSGMLSSVKSIAGPLAAAAGAAAVGSFLKGAITGASDLNETLSKTKVIFGDATKGVVAFAEDSKRNILLTKQQALDAAATFGVFGKSAGLTGKDLGGFSTELTALASDLSSFYNTSTDQAVTALGAALRGESEPIRAFGVLLDDASLRSEALRMGLIKTTKTALTPQNKVLAAQALIMKQTKDAQGDAARTASGFANQTKILNKNFIDIRNEVGSALLPIVTKFTTFLAGNLKPAFEAIKDAIGPVISFFKGFGSAGTDASGKVSGFASVIKTLKDYVAGLAATLGPIVQQVVGVVGPAFKAIADVIKNSVLPAIAAFLPAVLPITNFLIKIVGKVLVGVLQAAVAIIKGVFTVIAGILNVFAGLFTGDWSRLWKGVKQIFAGLWDAIFGIVKGAITIIVALFKGLFSLIWNVVKTGFELLFNIIKSGIVNTVKFFIDLPGKILGAMVSLPKKLFEFGVNVLKGFIGGIKSMAGGIITAIKDTITDKLPSFVKKALGIQSPSKVFKEIGKNVGLGFIKGVQGTQDQIKSTFAKLAELVKKTGSKALISAVSDAQKKILDLAKSRDVLTEQYKDAKGALEDLKKEAKDYATSVKDSIVATGNFSDDRSFDAIVRNLTASVEQAKKFNTVLTGLKDAGLNNTALSQLVEQGPAGALAAAQALLSSGSIGIKTVNELQAELAKQGAAIGKTISGSIYDAAISDAEKSVNTIAKDLTKVEDKIVGVAAALAKEIAKIGKIDAPAWLSDLIGVTKYTAKTVAAPKSPTTANKTATSQLDSANASRLGVVVNNYNPVAEKTSVTVSNTLTRLALIGAYDR